MNRPNATDGLTSAVLFELALLILDRHAVDLGAHAAPGPSSVNSPNILAQEI